jgi:hypothetical protein
MTTDMTMNIDYLLNKGIKSFGYENVINIINSFYNKYNLPIVSIGSGIGTIEYLSNKKYKINWICIDIDNNPIHFPSYAHKYITEPLMNINYNSCDELIKNNSSIIGNCVLFLNWCLPNESTYDYDAIIKLKPLAVLSIYEVYNNNNGCAGGEMFYNWTINSDYHLKEMYKLYYDNSIDDDVEYEENDIRIGWWENNYNEDAVIINMPCKHYIKKTNCCIS